MPSSTQSHRTATILPLSPLLLSSLPRCSLPPTLTLPDSLLYLNPPNHTPQSLHLEPSLPSQLSHCHVSGSLKSCNCQIKRSEALEYASRTSSSAVSTCSRFRISLSSSCAPSTDSGAGIGGALVRAGACSTSRRATRAPNNNEKKPRARAGTPKSFCRLSATSSCCSNYVLSSACSQAVHTLAEQRRHRSGTAASPLGAASPRTLLKRPV